MSTHRLDPTLTRTVEHILEHVPPGDRGELSALIWSILDAAATIGAIAECERQLRGIAEAALQGGTA